MKGIFNPYHTGLIYDSKALRTIAGAKSEVGKQSASSEASARSEDPPEEAQNGQEAGGDGRRTVRGKADDGLVA